MAKASFGSKSKAPKITGARTGGVYGSAKNALGNKMLVGPLGSRPSKSR